MIGQTFQAEWRSTIDTLNGRSLRQLTSAPANNYPLYYFIPSHTPSGDKLVFHSERSGWVQLYVLDLTSGGITQLTHAQTSESGWAIWCEAHLRGVYNHLSALNGVRREVYYFQDNDLRCTHIDTLHNRVVHQLPGRMPIGQTAFSPDGRYFAFIHADEIQFRGAWRDREALRNMRQFSAWRGATGHSHEAWRNALPCVIGIVDTATGDYREVCANHFHVHHVLWFNNHTLLLNHTQNHEGIWLIDLEGQGRAEITPLIGDIVHQIVVPDGLCYETRVFDATQQKTENWLGRFDSATKTKREVRLPTHGYVHTGNDPLGKFVFIEDAGQTHTLATVHGVRYTDTPDVRVIRHLPTIPTGQRYHAHPFLSPDREWLYFTELIDGFSQIMAMRVADLVAADDGW